MSELDSHLSNLLSMELKRTLSLKMQEVGVPNKKIAEVLLVSLPFISKWKKKYKGQGLSCLAVQYEGRPSYLSCQEREEIITHISQQSRYSLPELVEYIESNYGVTFKSKQSYYDLFSAGGLSWHKTQKSNPKKDDVAVLEKRAEIKKKLDSEREKIEKGEIVVLMQDECHLIWGDTCGYTWLPKNQKVPVDMTNFRQRQTYYGFVNLLDKQFQLYEYQQGNGIYTVDFLKKVRAAFKDKQIWMFWDGATYHKGQQVKDYLAELNAGLEEKDWKIQLIAFEKNAPEQNPVEDIWLQGKNFLRRNFYKFTSFAKVRKGFREFLNHNTFQFAKYQWYF